MLRQRTACGIGDGRPGLRPGLRRDSAPDYDGAFLITPDNNNVEAVCFGL
ncbi:hypothetical protein PT2222_190053 [Paraburkholderia tropica]